MDKVFSWAARMVMCAVLCFITGCTTHALWDATDPHEYVAVPKDEISEKTLQKKGVEYYSDDTRSLYYVEKSQVRKLGDYTMRALATPVTVAIDASPVILVIGVLIYAGDEFGYVPTSGATPSPLPDPEETKRWNKIVEDLHGQPVQ